MRGPSLIRGCLIAAAVAGGGLAGCGFEQTELQVKVVDAGSGASIPGASVEVGGFRRENTNLLGVARFLVRPGTYDLEVRHPRYTGFSNMVTVFTGMAATATVRLEPAPPPTPGPSEPPAPGPTPSPGASTPAGPSPSPSPAVEWQNVTLFGRVTDPTGARVPRATVFVESDFGIPFGHGTTNAQGEYRIGMKLPKGKPSVRVAAMADGYHTKIRYAAPTGTWRLDFAGAFCLQPNVPEPQEPPQVTVTGEVKDTMGRAVKFGMVKAEAEGVRHPYKGYAWVTDGKYALTVPTQLPLRFTASALHHRPVTFVETVKGTERRFDFTGYRALDPTPIMEGM
jgi:Carboxypeptidase regulatory-like domain